MKPRLSGPGPTPDPAHARRVRGLFDRLAPGWGEHYAPNGVLRDRLERFAGALEGRVARPARVLDFGCGTGEVACSLAARGWRVTACDPSASMLAEARRRAGADAVRWLRFDLASPPVLPFEAASFGAVVASSVFEYLARPEAYFVEIGRILRTGGAFLLTVPDMTHPRRIAEARKARLRRRLPVGWLPRSSPFRQNCEYLRMSINRPPLEDWRRLLEEAGFAVEPMESRDHPLALIHARRAGSETDP